MSRPFGGAPFARPRTVAIAVLLLTCTSVIPAEADPEARFQGTGKADPIRIENVRRANGPVAGESSVQFDLAWDHSWRAAWEVAAKQHGGTGTLRLESWDAAWVFAKFRKRGDDGWSHATLSTKASDHSVPAGAKLDVGASDDGKRGVGVFVYRNTTGHGANNWKGVKLCWLHKADGVDNLGALDLEVFAIRMVYVPQCAFWLGDGSTTANAAGRFSAGDTDEPFRIESGAAIVLGGTSKKNLGNHDGLGMERAEDFTSSGAQILPAEFPKGYAAFYCMRHEITEGQYVDFLNTVSSAQQGRLAPIEQRDGRSLTGVRIAAPGKPGTPAVYESEWPHVACRSLLWRDCMAYAAWAGLRPMTELEFEKACRGPLKPVPNEYAWGTAGIAGTPYTKTRESAEHDGYVVRNPGKPNEHVVWEGGNGPDATRGNAIWDGAIRREGRHGRIPKDAVNRPLRVGVFATPRSGRVEAGASYWGILELSGNLWERVMTVGNPYGRRFAGTHGHWAMLGKKGPESYGMGSGIRGGAVNCWPAYNDIQRLCTSDRERVSRTTPIHQEWNGSRHANRNMGFRCVRTAEMRLIPAGPPTVRAVPRPMQAPNRKQHSAAGRPTLRRVADWLDWKTGINNVTIDPGDEKTAKVTFDISWNHSWRDKNNHDAAWVFFKVRAGDKADWQHVRLAADKVLNPTGYGQAKGGTQVDLIVPRGDDGFTGLFVRRAASGEGPLAASRVTVIWDLTANKGITKDLKGVSIRPFGIRMVYVPEGPFYLGSGGLELGGFYQYTDGSQHIQPYRVTGPGAIRTGKQAGKLWARKHGGPLQDGGEIPASFPNGYAAFYCMKHQIAPEQYAAFLNTLTKEQAEERYAGRDRWVVQKKRGQVGEGRVLYSGGQGHVLRATDTAKGGYSSKSRTSRAGPGCFGLSWADGAAFAAWAGLRPMTELEIEKAVRGTREPMPNEVGPSYWGIGGFNKWDWDAFKGDPQSERAVTVSNAAGRRFKGTHGRGTLILPADWPQADAVGSGMRCTHYALGTWDLQRARLSDRFLAAVADPERCPSHKWRGVRTAPKGVGHEQAQKGDDL